MRHRSRPRNGRACARAGGCAPDEKAFHLRRKAGRQFGFAPQFQVGAGRKGSDS